MVDFPGKGHEQSGQRPGVVLGSANGLTLVVPLTSSLGAARFSHTFILEPTKDNGLTVASVVLIFHLSSLDLHRFQRQIGWIPNNQREAIDALITDLMKLT